MFIDRQIIEEETNLINYNLSYPIIKELEFESNIINLINKLIYEDVVAFKEVTKHGLSNNIFKLNDYVFHAISEYKISFNEKDIISIYIEFCELVGLYDTTYLNSYNYDINLEKKIMLSDLFDKDTNYIDIINKQILYEVNYILDKYREDYYEIKGEAKIFEGIYDSQTFYIEEDGIVISFSSYELSKNISQFIDIKLLFSDYIDYLSEYTINNIYRGKNESI